MKPSEVKKAVNACFDAGLVPMLWGPPGVGKSSVLQQIADSRGAKLTDIRTAYQDPTDMGLPNVDKAANRHGFTVPDFLPADGCEDTIIVLDEFPQAVPLVMNTWSSLILDRKLRDNYRLPDNARIALAGNRMEDKASTNRMPKHMLNRLVHIDFDYDFDEWVAWALDNGIATEVIAFLRYRPELLFTFDPSKHDKAFCTPRSWEFASKLFLAGVDSVIEFDLYSGCIGAGAAAEFVGFLKIFRKLVSPDVVLANPGAADVPTDAATCYALCGALARQASDNNFGRIIEYARRMPKEFEVLLVTSSYQDKPELVNTRELMQWRSENAQVMS